MQGGAPAAPANTLPGGSNTVLKYSGKLLANECLKLLWGMQPWCLSVIHLVSLVEATASLGLGISPNLFLSLF